MTFPSHLHELVEKLSVAVKKQKYLQEQIEKLQAIDTEVTDLRIRLIAIVEGLGFPEEAVDLLLAAR